MLLTLCTCRNEIERLYPNKYVQVRSYSYVLMHLNLYVSVLIASPHHHFDQMFWLHPMMKFTCISVISHVISIVVSNNTIMVTCTITKLWFPVYSLCKILLNPRYNLWIITLQNSRSDKFSILMSGENIDSEICPHNPTHKFVATCVQYMISCLVNLTS